MEDNLRLRLEEIKQMPVSEIVKLPEYSDKEIGTLRKPFTLSTWKIQQEGGMIEIVVQAYYYHFLGMGTMMADGFLMDSSGTFLTLPDEIRWKYC